MAVGPTAHSEPQGDDSHVPLTVDNVAPAADEWTQTEPYGDQIPELVSQPASNLYPPLSMQAEPMAQTSGLYPPLPTFAPTPATEAGLATEGHAVQSLMPDTQLDLRSSTHPC